MNSSINNIISHAMLKKILTVLVLVFILIQFIRLDKNQSDDLTYHISTKYTVPEKVNLLLKTSCNDCHSNYTRYPWYATVQPVAWWLDGHIKDGKKHLNFSEFTKLPIAVQNHKFDEIIEMVEEHEMPLASYTYLGLHEEANLTKDERKALIDWSKDEMARLKANYPADSLVMKRRKKPSTPSE
jgi:hypothetical protein